jgi:hypothetical protein
MLDADDAVLHAEDKTNHLTKSKIEKGSFFSLSYAIFTGKIICRTKIIRNIRLSIFVHVENDFMHFTIYTCTWHFVKEGIYDSSTSGTLRVDLVTNPVLSHEK